MKKSENRYTIEQSSLRAYVEEDKKIIEGRPILFNSESKEIFEDNKEFIEVIERGALDDTDFRLAYLTYNHSRDDVFATVRSKSLSPIPDENGMLFRAVLNNTQKANDMYELVQAGDIAGLSFNMVVPESDMTYKRGTDGILRRTIHKIRAIREISLVGGLYQPVYNETQVWARGLDEYLELEKKQLKEIEASEKQSHLDKLAQRQRFLEIRKDIYKN